MLLNTGFLPFTLYWFGSILSVAASAFILYVLHSYLQRKGKHEQDNRVLLIFSIALLARAIFSFVGIMVHDDSLNLNVAISSFINGAVIAGFATWMWKARPRGDTILMLGRKEVEYAVREVAYNLSISGWVVAENIYINDANKAFLETFGYSPSELTQLELDSIFHPDERDIVKRNLLAGHVGRFNVRALKKSGEEIVVEARGKKLLVDGVELIVLSIHDVTDQVREIERLRAQLQYSQNQLATLRVHHDIIKSVSVNGDT